MLYVMLRRMIMLSQSLSLGHSSFSNPSSNTPISRSRQRNPCAHFGCHTWRWLDSCYSSLGLPALGAGSYIWPASRRSYLGSLPMTIWIMHDTWPYIGQIWCNCPSPITRHTRHRKRVTLWRPVRPNPLQRFQSIRPLSKLSIVRARPQVVLLVFHAILELWNVGY